MGCGCGKIVDAVKHVAHGAAGLVKAATGIGTVSWPVERKRRELCRSCPHHVGSRVQGSLTSTSKCDHPKCGCFIIAKCKVASETCPLNHW